jgi:hypothetical protein
MRIPSFGATTLNTMPAMGFGGAEKNFQSFWEHDLAVPQTPTWQGAYSEITEPRIVVARTDATWEQLRNQVDALTSPDEAFDADKHVAVGIFLGARPTAGYQAEILSGKTAQGKFVVLYKERQPKPGQSLGQTITTPYLIRLFPKTGAPVIVRQSPWLLQSAFGQSVQRYFEALRPTQASL